MNCDRDSMPDIGRSSPAVRESLAELMGTVK